MKYQLIRSIFLLLLVGCAPSTLTDLRFEGEAQTKKLAVELREIETKEDLQKAVTKLRRRFNKIAQILVKVRAFVKEGDLEPSLASEELFIELARLYEMPEGRKVIEQAQTEAMQLVQHQ